jgi:hypothetical protein
MTFSFAHGLAKGAETRLLLPANRLLFSAKAHAGSIGCLVGVGHGGLCAHQRHSLVLLGRGLNAGEHGREAVADQLGGRMRPQLGMVVQVF